MTSGSVGAEEGVAVLEMGPDILWFDIGVPQHIGRFPPCNGIKVINYRVLPCGWLKLDLHKVI